jgi:hypothetical protein
MHKSTSKNQLPPEEIRNHETLQNALSSDHNPKNNNTFIAENIPDNEMNVDEILDTKILHKKYEIWICIGLILLSMLLFY